MAYINQQGRTVFRDDVTFFARSTKTAGETSAAQELGDKASIYVECEVYSAPGGTSPTLVVVVQGSNDNQNWFELGRIGSNGYSVGPLDTAPANITAAGVYRGIFPVPKFVRCLLTLGGTSPSFDLSVVGNAA